MAKKEEGLFQGFYSSKASVKDESLKQVITLRPRYVPHTFGRHAKKRFAKAKVDLVERLINKLMRGGTGRKVGGRVIRTHGRLQGKKRKVMKFVREAFEIIKSKGKDPLKALVKAVENAGPREETTRVKLGGISYQIAVDVSSLRRVDIALRNISLSALMKSFNTPKSLAQALAEEILYASEGDIQNSYAIKKKDEIERIAKSAR